MSISTPTVSIHYEEIGREMWAWPGSRMWAWPGSRMGIAHDSQVLVEVKSDVGHKRTVQKEHVLLKRISHHLT